MFVLLLETNDQLPVFLFLDLTKENVRDGSKNQKDRITIGTYVTQRGNNFLEKMLHETITSII